MNLRNLRIEVKDGRTAKDRRSGDQNLRRLALNNCSTLRGMASIKRPLADLIMASDVNQESRSLTDEFKDNPTIVIDAESPVSLQFSAEFVSR